MKEKIIYVICGGITTSINYATYILATVIIGLDYLLGTVAAWFTAVTFAYFSNKRYVFYSTDYAIKTIIHEGGMFLSARLFTGLLELGLMFFTVSILGMNDKIMKLAVLISIIVINYICSKNYVFKKRG